MTETQQKWLDRVRDWRRSGVSAAEYASGRDFAPATLTHWASRLRHELAKAPAESSGAAMPLARVEVVAATPLIVEVAGARIEVRAGFDRALLRDVVTTLGSGGAR